MKNASQTNLILVRVSAQKFIKMLIFLATIALVIFPANLEDVSNDKKV